MEGIPRLGKRKQRAQEGEEQEQERQTQIEEKEDYSEWANPNVLQYPTAVESLKKWCSSVCPEVMLATVRFFLERIRSDNEAVMSERWLRAGGWKGIVHDLKKAERMILDVYGLRDER